MNEAKMREGFEKWDVAQRAANPFRSEVESCHDSIVWQAAYARRDAEVEELKAHIEKMSKQATPADFNRERLLLADLENGKLKAQLAAECGLSVAPQQKGMLQVMGTLKDLELFAEKLLEQRANKEEETHL